MSYAQNSDYKQAIHHREQALKYNPNDASSIYVIGTYYERLNNFKEAENYISKALKLLDQPLGNEYRTLGKVLNLQKKHKEAIVAFQKALDENPTDIMSAFILLNTKDKYYADIDTRIQLFQNFIKKHKNSPFANFAERRLKELKEEKFLNQD